MSQPRTPMDCAAVDELDAAFALGAVDASERRAIVEHLDSCTEPHTLLRSMLGAGTLLAASLEPVEPPAELRRRLMTTIRSTAQEHKTAQPEPDGPRGRGWLGWLSPGWARGLAAAGVAGVLILGGINVGMLGLLSSRDQELESLRNNARVLDDLIATIGAGEAAYRVDGPAGRGFVVESPGEGSTLVITNVEDLSEDELYELWLIAGDGAPVAVGTFEPPSGNVLAIVNVEQDLEGFDTFAVTVEASRVDAPTSDPVMVATLGG